MSTVIMPVNETLAEGDVYSTPTGGTTTSEVLSWESIISAVSAWSIQKRPMRIRLQGFSPNAAVIGTIQKLYSLGELQEGWNSYGAQPIQREVIHHVARWVPSLLKAATPAPAVVPRVRGGLQLEWHRNGIDLEIYVDSSINIRFEAEDLTSAETIEAPLSGNEALLNTWIARISD